MQEESFACGAMRDCFRMKKLSSFANDCWDKAHNYVAKNFRQEGISNKAYFDDVRLQMDAKRWAEEFNKFNPPKKVRGVINSYCKIGIIQRPRDRLPPHFLI